MTGVADLPKLKTKSKKGSGANTELQDASGLPLSLVARPEVVLQARCMLVKYAMCFLIIHYLVTWGFLLFLPINTI